MKKTIHYPPPHFFLSVKSFVFFLAHSKSSEVEPGRWWGYSLGKMCSNVIILKEHGAKRKDGLWYFCLLNLMVWLWHLYLLNVQNLIHHCWQSEHVLCGWHSLSLPAKRSLTFILFRRLRRGGEQEIRPWCHHPGEMEVWDTVWRLTVSSRNIFSLFGLSAGLMVLCGGNPLWHGSSVAS